MTDLGLAPCCFNIIAEYIYQEYVAYNQLIPNDISMMVGGLPQYPNNTLKYACTWSFDGLVNEYKDIKFVSIGPGFVNTKINLQSIKNKKK